MPSITASAPGTLANVAGVGALAWSSPSNAATSNNVDASALFYSGHTVTNWLQSTGYDFSALPSGVTILGVVVEYECAGDGSTVKDYSLKLVKGGTISGTDKASASAWDASDSYQSRGGAADLWGLTLTAADIKASNFGFALSATGGLAKTASVDHAGRITVYYVDPSIEPDDAYHVHTADASAVPLPDPIEPDDAYHEHVAESSGTVLSDSIQPADAYHLHLADVSGLGIQPDGAYHVHAAAQSGLGLVPASAYHEHVADQSLLGIQPASTYHVHSAGQSAVALRAPVARREYYAFLRATIDGTDYAWGSAELYRAGAWHEGKITDFPAPSEAFSDDFGLLSEDSISLRIEDADLGLLALADPRGTDATLELLTVRTHTDGGTSELTWSRGCTIAAYRRVAGACDFDLVDLDRSLLSKTYPANLYEVADHAELYEDHVGRFVPYVVGIALKVPLTLIATNSDGGPWDYAACEVPAAGTPTVLTVYRDGRIVSGTEYTLTTTTVDSLEYLVVRFAQEQIDFGGAYYTLEADIQGTDSRNVADELSRILTWAGVSVDAASFAAAAAVADAAKMEVDVGYVEPRTVEAITQDLLLVLRGHLYRDSAGAWAIVQDTVKEVTRQYAEEDGDLVQVAEYTRERQPATVELEYRPARADDPSAYRYLISRSAGGASGTVRYSAPYIREHETADRLLCYLALKAQHRAMGRATVHDEQIALGEVVSIESALLWSGAKSFIVPAISRPADSNDIELQEYVAAAYTYTPGTLPSDATTGYQPDYSQTPPEAPTGLAVVSTSGVVDVDGSSSAKAAVRAIPPAANWQTLWFMATNSATNEIYLGMGADIGGGYYGVTLAGLRPNVAHTLIAWAVNAYSVDGEATAPVSFTSGTYSTAPAAPTGLAVIQGTGRAVKVSWSALTSVANLKQYRLERKLGLGGSWTELYRGLATQHIDVITSYGTATYYRVRAEDSYGNLGSYSAEANLTPSASIGTGDVQDDAITSQKRQDVNSYSWSTAITAGSSLAHAAVSHGLGRQPMFSHRSTGSSGDKAIQKQQAVTTTTFVPAIDNWGETDIPSRTYTWDYW